MAFFKFRQRGPAEPKAARATDAAASGAAAETVESLRRRARHRLIGAVVLVALAVIGFPLLFDTEPRPVTIDAPITIPDRDSVPPLQVPAQAAPQAPTSPDAREAAVPAPAPAAEPGATAAGAIQESAEREAEAAAAREREQAELQARREAEAQARREAEARARQEEQAKARREAAEREAARARAALEGRDPGPAKAPVAASESGRFVVQIGAFADGDAAREARQKAERAGLKTYTQVVDTKDGKRTRVRVGPFASRAEAEKAVDTLKKAGLPGGIFSL